MTGRLEQALRLAEKGFFIFPIDPDTRTPVVPWRRDSTRDPEIIKNWWICPYTSFVQDYNIGVDTGKSGVLVVDIDCKKGKKGKESADKLEAEYGFEQPFTVQTPSGGLHYYYIADRNYRNTSEFIAEGIDTRGDGGFVIAPGSATEKGEYTWIKEPPSADFIKALPAWLSQLLDSKRSELMPAGTRDVLSEDAPDDIARARDYLSMAEPAVEGEGGDHHTFAVAAKCKDLGVSEQTCFDLMLDWNETCSPPWDGDDLKRKIHNAYQYGKKEVGVASPHAEFEPIPQARPPALLTRLTDFKLKDIPPRELVFGHMAIARKLGILVAPPGAGKSTFTLTMAASKASGKNLLGIDPHGPGAVALYNNEDDMEEMHRRLGAIMQHFGLTHADFGGRLFLNSGENRPLRIAKRVGANNALKPEDADALIADVKEHDIKLLIIDPFSETHPAAENSNEEMLTVSRMYRYVGQMSGCAPFLVHHTRKPDSGDSEGHSGNMDSMRGASSLAGVARTISTLFTMSEKQAKQYGIPEENRKNYVLLELAKANMSAPGAGRLWYERVGECINRALDNPDGENVGILKPVKLSIRKDAPTDAMRALALDIEGLVDGAGDAGMTISEIAKSLVTNYPMHIDKQPGTLEKAIRRLFENGTVEAAAGILYLAERPMEGRKRTLAFIRWVQKQPELDALL